MASNVILSVILAVIFVSVMFGHQANLMHEVGGAHAMHEVGGAHANPFLQALEEQCKQQRCRPELYWISDNPGLVGCQHTCTKLVPWFNTLLGWPFSTVFSMPRKFGMFALLALARSTAMVFDFVAQRLLCAWRPREFDQACMEMSQKPQRVLDLVLSVAIIVALNCAACVITNREGLVALLLVHAALFASTKPVFLLVKSFLNKSYQALKQL